MADRKNENPLEIKLNRTRRLRRLILTFFAQPEMSRNMHKQAHFVGQGFSNREIRDMMYACETAGLIYKSGGNGPGSIYALLTDGNVLMRAMDLVAAQQAKVNDDNESEA